MKDNYFSSFSRFVNKVVVFLALGLVVFPAAEFVSAAGISVPAAAPSSPGEDSFVYLPMVFKNWPPLPKAPVLDSIASPVIDAPYNLTWSFDLSQELETPSFFTIEESEGADFANSTTYTTPAVFSTTLMLTSYEITKPLGTVGTYYYRVRAHNVWGGGRWSTVRSVFVTTRQDSFDDVRTNWRSRRTSSPELALMDSYYVDNNYYETYVRDMFDFAIFSPLYPAPEVPYSLKMRTRIMHQVNEVSYGLAFGGNMGTFCDVERANARSANGCFAHYYRINVIWAGNYLKFNVSRVDSHDDRGRGNSVELHGFYNLSGKIGNPADWQVWEVKVYDDSFAIYLNDTYLFTINDATYLDEPYYGIFSSTFEYNNAHFQHSYFYATPIDDVVSDRLPKDQDGLPY